MRHGVEEAVRRVLVGEPLRTIHRAATLICLGFGRRRWTTNRRGKRILVAEYALHTECPWRLLGPEGLVTGKYDICWTRGEPPLDPDEDEKTWGGVGTTRCDERIERLRSLLDKRALVVSSASVDAGFGLDLDLGRGYSFRVLPNATAPGEYWRLFRGRGTHLVVRPGGLLTPAPEAP
jgi:hypothetical protein